MQASSDQLAVARPTNSRAGGEHNLVLARRVFDAGVLALGHRVDGHSAPRDLAYARRAFTRASELAPEMGDAWMGRAATGELSSAVLYNLYKHRGSLHTEQRRLGLDARTIAGRLSTGFYLDYPLVDRVTATAAYACSMIGDGDFDGALEALDTHGDDPVPILDFTRALLNFRTQRWSDVLSALADSVHWDDEYLNAAADLMVGTSCAQLGLFGEAMSRLESAEGGPIPALRASAQFTRGLCLREAGREDEARALFENIYSQQPDFTDNARALRNPNYRIAVTTAEHIAARINRWDADSVVPGAGTDTAEADAILRSAEAQLAKQVGLATVKSQVVKLRAAAELAKIRQSRGMSTPSRSQHMAFTGPPGTGKTTIARIIAQLYHGLGILKSDTVVECSRRDLVSDHLGGTALKTAAVIDRALDGVLFIDEAYSLIQTGLSGGDAFGREAVETLLARMENDRDRLVVIIAGYDSEIDRFLAANDGLGSRFARRLRFASYTPEELGQIGRVIAEGRGSVLTDDARQRLVDECALLADRHRLDLAGTERSLLDLAGNARFIRNVIEAAEEERELRLSQGVTDLLDLDESELTRITESDVLAARVSMMSA